MNYICGDRGTEHCPCHLMGAGRCYTCTMTAEGYCSCEEKAGWQGTCPYSEYLQEGNVIRPDPWNQPEAFRVLGKTSFAPEIAVLRVEVPAGLAEQCSQPGTYMMAEVLGWRAPLSILRSVRMAEGDGEQAFLEFLVKEAGVKTRALLREAEETGFFCMAGPYYNGLPGIAQLEELPELVVARGVAAAPLIHMLDGMGNVSDCTLYLDDEGLPKPFLQAYLPHMAYEQADLRSEETQRFLCEKILQQTESGKEVLLLVSPHYAEILCSGLSEVQKERVIRPNPANLCCAMGICGSCSHTDGDGVTVKLCKCSQAVIK